jgi:hypothetical protein
VDEQIPGWERFLAPPISVKRPDRFPPLRHEDSGTRVNGNASFFRLVHGLLCRRCGRLRAVRIRPDRMAGDGSLAARRSVADCGRRSDRAVCRSARTDHWPLRSFAPKRCLKGPHSASSGSSLMVDRHCSRANSRATTFFAASPRRSSCKGAAGPEPYSPASLRPPFHTCPRPGRGRARGRRNGQGCAATRDPARRRGVRDAVGPRDAAPGGHQPCCTPASGHRATLNGRGAFSYSRRQERSGRTGCSAHARGVRAPKSA